MTDFRVFSDEARLYAENNRLIDLMHEKMISETGAFLEAVRSALQERLDAEVRTKITKAAWWYCWVVIPGLPPDASFQVWCKINEPEIVLGRLELGAGAPLAPPKMLERLAPIALRPGLRDFCTPGNGGAWSLFTATIAYGREQPVTDASEQLERLFRAAWIAHFG